MFDSQCAAGNMKGQLSQYQECPNYGTFFVEPCEEYTPLQLVFFINPVEKGAAFS